LSFGDGARDAEYIFQSTTNLLFRGCVKTFQYVPSRQ
jgi:hypothetical protein